MPREWTKSSLALRLLCLTNPTLIFVRNNVWNADLTYKTEFKNDRRSGSRLMDSMLKCVLDSKDEAERGRLLDELILAHSAPLIRKVLRQIVSDIASHGLNDQE